MLLPTGIELLYDVHTNIFDRYYMSYNYFNLNTEQLCIFYYANNHGTHLLESGYISFYELLFLDNIKKNIIKL
jgi:hypothetical protein